MINLNFKDSKTISFIFSLIIYCLLLFLIQDVFGNNLGGFMFIILVKYADFLEDPRNLNLYIRRYYQPKPLHDVVYCLLSIVLAVIRGSEGFTDNVIYFVLFPVVGLHLYLIFKSYEQGKSVSAPVNVSSK